MVLLPLHKFTHNRLTYSFVEDKNIYCTFSNFSHIKMSLCFQADDVSLGNNEPSGYLQIFRLKTGGVKTSLSSEKKTGELFMFTYSGHSFLFHKDLLQSYIESDEFFNRTEDNISINCVFCNQKNPYSLVTFYKLRNPDVQNQLEYESLESLLHAKDRKPLCDNCVLKILDATLGQLLIGSKDIVSTLI